MRWLRSGVNDYFEISAARTYHSSNGVTVAYIHIQRAKRVEGCH
ncbi:MAG: hypothetical protein QOH12_3350 [Solirubrobacteraceae bacterium]|nr:hypothetical protein [Solirubrobacteraceae bacterium]